MTKELLTTKEMAQALRYQAQSLRAGVCRHGHFHGIKPFKLPGGKLLWPADSVEKLLGVRDE